MSNAMPQRRLEQIERHISSATKTAGIQDVYILSAARTPTCQLNGSFSSISATQLGAFAIKSAWEKSGVPASKISDVYMGNVLQASVGQAPARQAALFAGLPSTVEAVTINKVCASGLKAIVLAAQNIQLGLAEAEIAGGMESMSRVPFYTNRPHLQARFGHQSMEDGLIKDGLWDVYNGVLMGNCAEKSAKDFEISREEQDQYAIRAYHRAQAAWKAGQFNDEIAPVVVTSKSGSRIINQDEGYDNLQIEKMKTLKPVFSKNGSGSVTAANASTMNDGASAVVLANFEIAKQYSKTSRVLSKIISSADAAVDPIDFSVAPAKAIEAALQRGRLSADQIAVWEINEAFAAVVKVNEKLLGLDLAKVNRRGGAIALGHALGSSGSRILTTLLHQLEPGEYGVAAICNGGGAATALVVQRLAYL